MEPKYLWRNLQPLGRKTVYIALTLPIVTGAVLRLFTILVTKNSHQNQAILRAPRPSTQDPTDLPYPPNALPGPRDISTPNGNIRIYEWGPATGKKILFIHGISTPCIAFATLATLLANQGYRVMLFDLFGRGYSDAPDPELYRQDMSLWTSQILLVLTSSELEWRRFGLVGYSMGGGIAAAFASFFPERVSSLVLIAPGGLIRAHHISRTSRWLYSGLLPAWVVRYYVGKRIRGPGPGPVGNTTNTTPPAMDKRPASPTDAAEAEKPPLSHHPAHAEDSNAPVLPGRPQVSIADTVRWQIDNHPGFLPSFISSIRYAPVSDEHERWRLIGRSCEERRRRRSSGGVEEGLDEGKVLMLLGESDPVIVADEVEEDAIAALGRDNVRVVRLEGGHDVPVVNARGCMDAMEEFWIGRAT